MSRRRQKVSVPVWGRVVGAGLRRSVSCRIVDRHRPPPRLCDSETTNESWDVPVLPSLIEASAMEIVGRGGGGGVLAAPSSTRAGHRGTAGAGRGLEAKARLAAGGDVGIPVGIADHIVAADMADDLGAPDAGDVERGIEFDGPAVQGPGRRPAPSCWQTKPDPQLLVTA